MKPEDVKKLADLARVELSESDMQKMPSEIDSILAYVHKISEVAGETSGAVEKNSTANGATSGEARIESAGTRNVTRPDEFSGGFENPAKIVESAPSSENSYVKVKKIM